LNARERFLAASRGGEVDSKPTLAWPFGESDLVVAETIEDVRTLSGGEKPVLYLLNNPFGASLADRVALNDLHVESPAAGSDKVAEYVSRLTEEGRASLEAGADGVFYLLQGARGAFCTPMQYGGYYLEADREILTELADANFNFIFVAGNDDVYIDFVSDLPAHFFAWDAEASTFDASYVRTLRSGALASSDPSSEVLLSTGVPSVADFLMKEPAHA
jgi:hypothetical protein